MPTTSPVCAEPATLAMHANDGPRTQRGRVDHDQANSWRHHLLSHFAVKSGYHIQRG
jgi:hypothetical protein